MTVIPINQATGGGDRQRRRQRAIHRRDASKRLHSLCKLRTTLAQELAHKGCWPDRADAMDRAEEIEARLVALSTEIRALRGGHDLGGAA